ncbi:VOC family protein [filamentous cyanobacterium LEGE 11480]|uniref:VOC family protein n=1 Tax=Romeriopsis navalis LEGE 11480 TaxID=2777977 RepID=A0A928VPB2_9CYAN|nr:VOC family protein [Romeriopsis navalis]MBE9031343.1 VOC family protein [Romeriopsis navalis LEGE 11480]
MSAIPYLVVRDAKAAIAFYQTAFGTTEHVRLASPDGKIMHAEIRLGDAAIMLADEFPDMGYNSPQAVGGTTVSIVLYVDDVDALFERAIAAGATVTMPLQDQFDGDRRGSLTDPFGHRWLLASKKEAISVDELQRRFQQMLQEGTGH